MPTLYYRVEAPGVNILKSVTDDTVTGILDELDVLRYFKDSLYIMSSFMGSSRYSDGNNVPNLTKNRCDVDVSYVMDKAQVPWPVETPYTTSAYGVRSSSKGTHTPLMIDRDANIFIEHHTVACALKMRCVLTFITFDDACKAFDMIQSRYRGTLVQTPFDLKLSYPVSMGLFQYLFSVYKAKTKYINKTIFDYIDDIKQTEISFDIRKSQMIKEDADRELMIRYKQIRCLAQITMDQQEPQVERIDQVPDTYTVSFDLDLQFGRPDKIAVHTPISVENKVLPASLFKGINLEHHYNPNQTGFYQDLLLHETMKRQAGNFGRAHQILRFPHYDDWFHVDQQYASYKYRPFLIGHFTLDGAVTTIDLKELGEIKLHPIALEIMKKTGNKLFDYGGLLNIGVYADNLRLGNELVSIDENLILRIESTRPDKEYHLMLSETTLLQYTDPQWDELLIKYRYFFPLTIERNLEHLISKRYFTITYDNRILNLIGKILPLSSLSSILNKMVEDGEDTYQIFQYTQSVTQLAEYLAQTPSQREGYVLPPVSDSNYPILKRYYTEKASPESRSLLVAFIENCLIRKVIDIDDVTTQFIEPNTTTYPHTGNQGGYYGFNTPLRAFVYNISTGGKY